MSLHLCSFGFSLIICQLLYILMGWMWFLVHHCTLAQICAFFRWNLKFWKNSEVNLPLYFIIVLEICKSNKWWKLEIVWHISKYQIISLSLGSSYAGCNGNVNCIIQPSVFNYLHHMSAKRTFTKNILCQIEFKTS